MATNDHNQLLNQISQLAGQINRHKNSQIANDRTPQLNTQESYPYPNTTWHNSRRGSLRGVGHSKPSQSYRNRSLVLTGGATPSTHNSTNFKSKNDTITTTNSVSGWVSKIDRHRQLINASIYDEAAQRRAKAIEETRKKIAKIRHDREKLRFQKHLQQETASSNYKGSLTQIQNGSGKFEINVQGIRFFVAKNGSKLVRVHDDINSAKSTPKVATVGPVKFYRSKNGNMYRHGVIKAHRATGIVKKINEPCKMFSTTGSCHNGPRCRYIHDPSKVAVCKEYLQKGSCLNGDCCDLSHELTPERTPSCLHFARGNCSNPNCRYMHVRVSSSALVCRSFGIYGYCPKGTTCMERHVNECPEFSNTGTCSIRGCKLPHREKASLMRNLASRNRGEIANDETSDVSSDEEDIDSDDYDSEELEEIINDDISDTEIPMQQDFVHLS